MERRLIQLGFILFVFGLFTGFAIPATASPRLTLTSHMEGVMNGMFLVLAGIVWPRVRLSLGAQKIAGGLLIYGTFANWLVVLLSGIWGAGSRMMPIAGGQAVGNPVQEGVIAFGLISLSIAMVVSVLMIIWGLRSQEN